ncbi:MAG: hypothetical protein HY348_07300 [Nitrospira defluvii]|nr:hypothetical protein [Nitrospira defluvii]
MENVIHGKGQAALNVCGCDRLHFTYGPITLHFGRDEFIAFADAVTRLASQLRQADDSLSVTPSSAYSDPMCH